ncbi:DUF551 domain-containing protein [Klebsiella pneumoniae]|nr:DUF551 domain-containing protein [Klebsiella pneumoniae]SWB34058.1 Eaa1 [Klebsiella pneumoniae]HBQ5551536.1 DUF551 domain-containing protein [Klebsiella pneumoniae]
MTSKFSIDNRELLQRISSGEAVVGIDFGNLIVRELAAFRLAAMDSEPVAVIDLANLDYLLSGADADVWPPEREEMGDVLLYRHPQPAPVVPEEATPDSIEILASARRRDHAVFQWDEDQRNAAADSWNACRAAILAAATQLPGSDPATVPGKWIPVSEQMPEDRTQVILWDAEIGEVTSGHYSHKTHTFYHCGDAIENEITHWMPTPAAPQEMKGE